MQKNDAQGPLKNPYTSKSRKIASGLEDPLSFDPISLSVESGAWKYNGTRTFRYRKVKYGCVIEYLK